MKKVNTTSIFIAPFRSFWQQRSLLHWPKSTAWLYHGCRNESENFFDEETNNIVQRYTAMSRIDGKDKTYVQHLLEKDQTFVQDVVTNRKGYIYICGKVSKSNTYLESVVQGKMFSSKNMNAYQ